MTTFGDALWWAVSTITTVGYGDHYPVTAAGHAIGIALMIVGVGMFGVVAASAAAWFISADQQEDKRQQTDTVTTLTAEITALRKTVSELSARLPIQPQQAAGELGNSPWGQTWEIITDVSRDRQMPSGDTRPPTLPAEAQAGRGVCHGGPA